MDKEIRIGIGDPASTANGFIEVWKRVGQGEKAEPVQHLNFENIETLLRTLTPGRWVLLKMLRTGGPMSIRRLSTALGRDYKNVHTDVKQLEHVGLINRTRDNKVRVPWDIVQTRLSLAA